MAERRITGQVNDPGRPAPVSGIVVLATATASASATIDFTTAAAFDGTYDEIIIKGIDIIPATDGADFTCRLSIASTFATATYVYGAKLVAEGGTDSVINLS